MRITFRRSISIFFAVLIFTGVSGVSVSYAATRYSAPSAPTIINATGGLEVVLVKWKKPSNNGGKPIRSYRVYIYPGNKTQECNGGLTACKVKIANPNKPSSKPIPVKYHFRLAAVNSVGVGSLSNDSGWVSVRFRATLDLTNSFRIPQSTPTPTASASGETTFDGSYSGRSDATVGTVPASLSTAFIYPTSATVTNGVITGSAGDWAITGRITDPAGVMQISVANPLYGTINFTATFSQDPATKIMNGNGKGTQNFIVPILGEIKVEFVFNVKKA